MTSTTTVRVHKDTRDRAAKIARETGSSVSRVIDRALERYEEDQFWDAFDAAVERNRGDHAEDAERARWDAATLKAGLGDE